MAETVGKIMMNGASVSFDTGALLYVLANVTGSDTYKQDVIVSTLDGEKKVKTNATNLLDVTFFLHPQIGLVYIATHSYQTIVSSGSYGSSTIPVFTVFKKTEKGVKYSYERKATFIRDLIYIGELTDLDLIDKYDPINKRT